WGQVRQHSGDFGGNLGQTLKDNPVPALLTSIGIAWMMASNGRHHDDASMTGSRLYGGNGNGRGRMREAGERVRERMHGVRDKIHGARESMRHRTEDAREGAAGAREKMSESAQHMRERAHSMSSSARYRANRARAEFGNLLEEQPLLLGALGLVAGVIAGAALPPTEHEDRAFGKTRDGALERAKQASAEEAREARERAEEAAESTIGGIERGGDISSTGDASTLPTE